jgi:hypothetical protein
MDAKRFAFEWRVLEGDEQNDWPPRPTVGERAPDVPAQLTIKPNVRRRRGVECALAAIVLACALAGFWLARRSDQVMTRVEMEIRSAAAAEDWTRQNRPRALPARVDAQVDPAWQQAWLDDAGLQPVHAAGDVTVRRIEVQGDMALVEMVVAQPVGSWLPVPYRQTRAYRETEQGWLRTAPSSALWGDAMTQATEHFVFVYRGRDAAAVQVAASRIEAQDARLRHELGLAPRPDGATTTILVTPALPPVHDPAQIARLQSGATVQVPSPALLVLPVALDPGEALARLVGGVLARRALDEALALAPPAATWQPEVVDGLALWLQWEQSDLPGQERACLEAEAQASLARGWRPRLAAIRHDVPSQPWSCTTASRVQPPPAMLAEMLIAYGMYAYGHDRLPALVEGLRRTQGWEELIPAVFGVTAEEFEEGWQHGAAEAAPLGQSAAGGTPLAYGFRHA